MFVKGQHIIIHNPSILTLEFAQRTWIESLLNQNTTNLFVRRSPITVGNTSIVMVKELIYVDLNTPNKAQHVLVSLIRILCRIDLETKKPLKICEDKRRVTNKCISSYSERETSRLRSLSNTMRSCLDETILLLKQPENTQCLFQCKLQVQYTDIDRNGHVNQSVYGKYIENALHEYSDEYHINTQYHIGRVTVHYVHEIRINRQYGMSYCTIKIFDDKSIRSQRQIVGTIENGERLCAQFKLMLVPYHHDRLIKLKSRM